MTADRGKKRKLKKRWLVLIVALIVVAGYLLITDRFREEEKNIRRNLRQAVVEKFPEQAAEMADSFGLRRYDADPDPAAMLQPNGKTVVLVHGLDEPGRIWMNLAPALHGRGYDVWTMDYPNDQPVTDSAQLLFDHLQMLPLAGVQQLALVTHSMGGLVAREMLTSPAIDYQQAAAYGQVPKVTGLVMVGTPNHGSELARFRFFTEIRDQAVQLAKGQGNWLGVILDGAGEAKIDLLPGSHFLSSLNSRPNPAGVRMLVIAGIASPWNEKEIDELIDDLHDRMPTETESKFEDLKRTLASLTNNVGDGLVTVDSTRLDGAEHSTVKGNHSSILRNLTEDSERVPPSIPIVIDFLERITAGQRI